MRPDPATESRAEAPEGGNTSPVLNVQQGFLSEDTRAPADRPFQRGQRPQHPTDASAGKPRERAAKVDGSVQEPERRSARDQAPGVREGKDAQKVSAAAEAKRDRDRSGAVGIAWGQWFVMVTGMCVSPCVFPYLQSHVQVLPVQYGLFACSVDVQSYWPMNTLRQDCNPYIATTSSRV